MEYKCPVCGAELPRDLDIIKPHTDEHIVEAIKKNHPDWAEEDGLCPKCYEYYKQQMSGG